ncbi:MAG: amidohydrolase family protein [Anaerolineales bacterium]|nr:amidohydrolase family protein [Anaerolineales bacterium]
MPKSVDVILTGFVVTMDEGFALYPAGAVAITGNSIIAVGPAEQITTEYEAAERHDYPNKVIMPGLVNAHTHVPMTLFRGLNDDLRLDVWLGYLMPLEREFVNPEFVKLGTEIACAEMIRSGVTTFADMYYYESDIAEATAVAGMRALLGQSLLVFPTPDSENYEDGLTYCRRFIEKWQGHELIQPAVAPHAWYTATPELLRACADLARAFDVPLHTHVSETAFEVSNCRSENGMPVVPWIDKHGLLETRLLCAHCVHIDQGEMKRLRKAGAGIAHCPTSNLKLASGFAQLGNMLDVGLNVGVGTDGPASNNDLDMFEEMRLAAVMSKAVSNDPTVVPARQALELATISGARAVHLGHLTGSLEAGKRADLIVVEMNGVHNWPQFHSNPDAVYSRLIYASKSTDVAHVMCNGSWLMQDRQLLTLDEPRALAAAAEVAARIDAFVQERESSPYQKLVMLAGVQRMESYEIQIKVPLADDKAILEALENEQWEVIKQTHYKQYDHYLHFDGHDPDAARLRFREDTMANAKGELTGSRTRLTLIGETDRDELANAVMLSRSRFLASATNSLRFYREYFDPATETVVQKERRRWRILFEDTEFALNLDRVLEPALPGYFLEVKARTWSRTDAIRKSEMVAELLERLGVSPTLAEKREYVELATAPQ